MKTKYLFLGLIMLLAFIGCSEDKKETAAPAAAAPATPTPTASTQSAQSASAGAQATSLASGSNTVLINLGNTGTLSGLVGAPPFPAPALKTTDPGLAIAGRIATKLSASEPVRKTAKKIASLKKAGVTAAMLITNSCTDGGTFITNTTTSDITFSNCREDDVQFDGTIGISDLSTVSEIHFIETIGTTGSPFVMLEFENNYATLVSKMEAALTMHFMMPLSGSTITLTTDGTMSVFDYISQEDYAMTFTNFSNAFTMGTGSASLVTSGGFSETWSEDGVQHSVSISFQNYTMTMVEGAGYEDISLSGSMTVNFTPDTCAEGTFTFVTNTAIRISASTGLPTQGEIVINGTVTITYGANGAITVTDASGSATYDNDYELAELCDFQTFDEEAPVSGGSTGTGSSTGNGMTITSSSADTDLNCYTDIHVNYYGTTTPAATTVGTWYIDWHQFDGCTNPSDILFEQALDITNDGVCDVGLDINGADYDITSGGLEHFIATTVPVGYYVVSMNNYSCANVSNNVTIQIGDSVFGPYACTYSTSDFEGTTAGAWCAVADIRVNTGGSFEVLSHNAALELWHDGAFGMFKPLTKPVRKR